MFVAYFIPALMGALATAMASLIWRAILAIGIGFVTYTGITLGLNALKATVMAGISGAGSDVVGLLGFLWVDKGITIIFSAVAVSISMRALGGSVKKMIFK